MKRTCDYCKATSVQDNDAVYDAPSKQGSWAYFCEAHYQQYANTNFPPTVLANIKE